MRINFLWLRLFVIRPKCQRFAEAAAGTLVLTGINGQVVSLKVIIGTDKIMATAFGAIADHLTVTGH